MIRISKKTNPTVRLNKPEYNTNASVTEMQNTIEENCRNMLYDPDFMELNSLYKHNIKIPMLSISGIKPKSICNQNEHNGCGAAIGANALNQCNNSMEAQAVACGLNQVFITHLMFCSNQYSCSKADQVKMISAR